jgi:hypothetical protein
MFSLFSYTFFLCIVFCIRNNSCYLANGYTECHIPPYPERKGGLGGFSPQRNVYAKRGSTQASEGEGFGLLLAFRHLHQGTSLCVVEFEREEGYKQQRHGEELAQEAVVVQVFRCSNVAVMLNVVFAIHTNRCAWLRHVMMMGERHHQTADIKHKQQS